MTISIHVDEMLARKKMRSKELAEKIGISIQNLSCLKNGKKKMIRLSVLSSLCQHLDCNVSNILVYQKDALKELSSCN